MRIFFVLFSHDVYNKELLRFSFIRALKGVIFDNRKATFPTIVSSHENKFAIYKFYKVTNIQSTGLMLHHNFYIFLL